MTSAQVPDAVDTPFGHEWDVVGLPFAPAAINDDGLIVGEQNGKAVQYQNGEVQVLPLPFDGSGVSYSAVDVTSLGAILGQTDRPGAPGMAWWPLPLTIPDAPVGVFVPAAMNKNFVVVGSSGDANVAFKWTPGTQYTRLVAPHHLHTKLTVATDVNDNGYMVGW
jgi:hypothetical protein